MSKKKKLPTFWYKVFKVVLGSIFNMYYRPTVINKEVIPKDGPIIVCGNHMHILGLKRIFN